MAKSWQKKNTASINGSQQTQDWIEQTKKHAKKDNSRSTRSLNQTLEQSEQFQPLTVFWK